VCARTGLGVAGLPVGADPGCGRTHDRFFPLDFQRRVARERLGLDVDVIPGGHLAALSRPAEVAERLQVYVDELQEQARST